MISNIVQVLARQEAIIEKITKRGLNVERVNASKANEAGVSFDMAVWGLEILLEDLFLCCFWW